MRLLFALLLATCAQAAVSPLHPRIYVRNDQAQIGHGLRVSELKARAQGPWARWRRPVQLNNAAAAMEMAARYLEDGNADDLKAVRDYLVAHTYSLEKNDVGGLLAGAEMMTAYDWIYNGLTPEDRALLAANLLKTCASSRHFIEHGGPDVNHNYLYMAMTTVATAGLVLSGEPEPYGTAGREYLALATHWLESPGLILDTWKARQGAWGEGSHYTFHETLRNLVLTLSAFRSASDHDYFAEHAVTMQQAAWFLIGNVRPDLTFVRTGDTQANRATVNLTVPITIEMMADGIPEAATQLHDLAGDLITAYGPSAVHALFGWGMRVYWRPDEPRTPSYRDLPLFERFGAGTLEQLVLRNGRGENSTHITITTGNQFTDHQHFDKGQFLIYHRGGLTVDSGGYDGMYRPGKHANEYAPRTVAHNALLIFDPDEVMPKGYTNDGGQRVVRNKQHHESWPKFLSHREREGMDAGRVTAADHTAGYSFVRADLSKAYSEKITTYQRLFTYLPADDVLVVFDRLRTARPFDQRWLLHFDTAPSVDGKAPATGIESHPGARWTNVHLEGSYDRGGTTAQYNGALFTETLLPAQHDVITTGGPGYEFYSTFARQNYPASNPRVNAPPRESGTWRMEVKPATPATEQRFLHVLHMAEGGAAQPAASDVIETEAATGVRIHGAAADHVVLFARSPGSTGLSLPLTYSSSSTRPTEHVITELAPDTAVQVRAGGKVIARGTVSRNGVFTFRDAAKGKRKIVVEAAR